MNNPSQAIQNNNSILFNALSWVFGLVVLVIGIINTFWGNDPGFGIFLILLSFVYYPPVNAFIKGKFGFAVPMIVKILLGVFIIWAALGVGELFDKIDIMMNAL